MIRRRELLTILLAGPLSAALPQRLRAATTEETRRRMEEYQRKALERFPFKLIETSGKDALAKWQELKSAGQGSPVVLAGDETGGLGSLLDPFGPDAPDFPSVEKILKTAAGIHFPGDLAKQKAAEAEEGLKQFKAALAKNPNMKLPQVIEMNGDSTRKVPREETLAAMMGEPEEPPLGEWPVEVGPSVGLTVARDLSTGEPFPKIQIGIAPSDDWTTLPAYLRWGGWNACPAAEHHVAAMRSWRERYGAELVGVSGDTINIRVARRPKTREEALALAREQYIYCNDIIDQGFASYSALAADLMANDWWFFWWD